MGPYLIERPLDEGGMGSVYVARHSLTEVRVALKVLHAHAGEATTTRFLREVRAASRIGHPGVVKVHDAGQTDAGALYLVMELLEGHTLSACIERGDAPSRLLSVVLDALPALAAAHAAGIVHRDLKPENLFVLDGRDAEDGGAARAAQVKLLDFGIALELHPSATRTGAVLGTPHYMSPEQAREPGRVGPASDVWAVGVMLYEILSGALPFDGESVPGVVVALCTEPHVPLGERCPELSPELCAIVDRCLRKDPDQRHADASALQQALAPWRQGAPLTRTGDDYDGRAWAATLAVAATARDGGLQVPGIGLARRALLSAALVLAAGVLLLPSEGLLPGARPARSAHVHREDLQPTTARPRVSPDPAPPSSSPPSALLPPLPRSGGSARGASTPDGAGPEAASPRAPQPVPTPRVRAASPRERARRAEKEREGRAGTVGSLAEPVSAPVSAPASVPVPVPVPVPVLPTPDASVRPAPQATRGVAPASRRRPAKPTRPAAPVAAEAAPAEEPPPFFSF